MATITSEELRESIGKTQRRIDLLEGVTGELKALRHKANAAKTQTDAYLKSGAHSVNKTVNNSYRGNQSDMATIKTELTQLYKRLAYLKRMVE